MDGRVGSFFYLPYANIDTTFVMTEIQGYLALEDYSIYGADGGHEDPKARLVKSKLCNFLVDLKLCCVITMNNS